MGRTQATYRRRIQAIRDNYMRLMHRNRKERYKELWTVAHDLSGPASALPYPDTQPIATLCMMLEAIARISEIKDKISDND